MELTEKQNKRIRKIAEVIAQGELGIANLIFELEEKIDEELPNVMNVLAKLKGDKGDDYVLTPEDKQEIISQCVDLVDVDDIVSRATSKVDTSKIVEQVKSQVKDGATPVKGKDYFTKEEIASFASDILKSIPQPEDGKPGKDADEESVAQKVELKLEKNLPKFGNGIRDALELLQDDERLDVSAIRGFGKMEDGITKRALGILDQRTQFLINKQTSNFSLSSFTTTDLAEGNNLYFTDQRAIDAVNLSGLVPYTGATADVDLGANDLILDDNANIIQGAGSEFSQYFDGTNQNFELTSGDFVFNQNINFTANKRITFLDQFGDSKFITALGGRRELVFNVNNKNLMAMNAASNSVAFSNRIDIWSRTIDFPLNVHNGFNVGQIEYRSSIPTSISTGGGRNFRVINNTVERQDSLFIGTGAGSALNNERRDGANIVLATADGAIAGTSTSANGGSIYAALGDSAGNGVGGHFEVRRLSGTPLLNITYNGNVGIGTTDPTEKLEVNGNILSNGDAELSDSDKGVILKSPNGTRWRVQIDNDGNLTTTDLT